MIAFSSSCPVFWNQNYLLCFLQSLGWGIALLQLWYSCNWTSAYKKNSIHFVRTKYSLRHYDWCYKSIIKRTNKPYSKQNNPIQTNRHFSLRANDRDFFFIYSSNFPRGLSLNYKCYRRHHNDVAKLYASSTNRFSPHSVFNGLLVLTNQIIALRQSSNYNRILYH